MEASVTKWAFCEFRTLSRNKFDKSLYYMTSSVTVTFFLSHDENKWLNSSWNKVLPRNHASGILFFVFPDIMPTYVTYEKEIGNIYSTLETSDVWQNLTTLTILWCLNWNKQNLCMVTDSKVTKLTHALVVKLLHFWIVNWGLSALCNIVLTPYENECSY